MITMATQTTVEVLDDINGETGAETVEFSVHGVNFEIDLASKNRAKFEKAFKEFVENAREVVVPEPVAVKKSASKNPEAAKMRAWAVEQGMAVPARGRISSEVQEAFHAAQSA